MKLSALALHRRHPLTLATAFYGLLTGVFTYPQVLGIHNRLPTDALGRPLEAAWHNSWILAWGARAALVDPLHLFDANAFWPRADTLAYSDHMFGHLPLSALVYWLSGNAVLLHNVILLLSFVGCGVGAFVLARSITRCTSAALLAGVVYGFCPIRFAEYPHVQMLSAQWMPLALFCLHRFYAQTRTQSRFPWGTYAGLVGFGALQSLCAMYYLLFFPILVGCIAVTSLAVSSHRARLRSTVWPLLAPVIWTLLVLPTLMPYVRVRNELTFIRHLHETVDSSPTLGSFLSVPAGNWLYGALAARLRAPEPHTFPGLVPILLGLVAVTWRPRHRAPPTGSPRLLKLGYIYAFGGIAMALLAMGPRIRVGNGDLCWGPYLLLYKFVPGFDGVRKVGWFAVPGMLCLSVLAALGCRRLMVMIKRPALRRAAPVLLTGLLLAEYASFPIPMDRVPVKDEIPEVYRWLAGQRTQRRIVEVPLHVGAEESKRLYYSTYHWHRTVNGKASFFPPERIAKTWSHIIPSPALAALMAELRIDYVIAHDWLSPGVSAAYQAMPYFQLERTFGRTDVFRLLCDRVPAPEPHVTIGELRQIPPDQWQPVANDTSGQAWLVQDGNPNTAWVSGRHQQPGMAFAIVLRKPRPVRALRISFGRHAASIPRFLVVRVGQDASNMTEIFGRRHRPDMFAQVYRSALQEPRNPAFDIHIAGKTCRAVQLGLAGQVNSPWAMAEIQVYEAQASNEPVVP